MSRRLHSPWMVPMAPVSTCRARSGRPCSTSSLADALGQFGPGLAREGDGGEILQRHAFVEKRVDEIGHEQAWSCRCRPPRRPGPGAQLSDRTDELRRRQADALEVAHRLKPPLRALQTGPSRHHEGQFRSARRRDGAATSCPRRLRSARLAASLSISRQASVLGRAGRPPRPRPRASSHPATTTPDRSLRLGER